MRHLLAAGALAIGLTMTLVAPAEAQKRAAVSGEQIEARAVVESVDVSGRMVLLRAEDGALSTVKVGPEVRNLAAVKPGDVVVMRVRLGVIAQIAAAAGPAPGSMTEVAGRAPAGGMPGAFAGEAIRMRVTLNSYDAVTRKANITLANGEQRTLTVQSKAMQDFAMTLRTNDKVDLTVVRSVAIAVVPAK